jgi:hypothetical protein
MKRMMRMRGIRRIQRVDSHQRKRRTTSPRHHAVGGIALSTHHIPNIPIVLDGV